MTNRRSTSTSIPAAFLKPLARAAAVYLVWTLLVVAATPARPAVEAAWALLCSAALVWWATSARGGRWRGPGLEAVGRPPARWWLVVAAILPMVLLAQALELLYGRLPFVPELRWPVELPNEPSWEMLRIAVLAVWVFPVIEEVACRGCLQAELNERFGATFAIGAAAVLFALPHGNPAWYPLYVVLGVVLGIAVHVTGSVWAGFLLHAGYNGVSLLLHQVERGSSGLDPTASPLGIVGVALVAAGSAVALARLARTAAASPPDSLARSDTLAARFAAVR